MSAIAANWFFTLDTKAIRLFRTSSALSITITSSKNKSMVDFNVASEVSALLYSPSAITGATVFFYRNQIIIQITLGTFT